MRRDIDRALNTILDIVESGNKEAIVETVTQMRLQ